MKSKELEEIVTEKITIFGEVLDFIDTNKIERSINKISKNLCLDGVIEEEKSIDEEEEISNTNYISFHSSQIKNAKFPCYDGSFKNDINKFLKAGQNKEVNKLYEKIIKEIQKVYLGYTHIENKIYKKINEYIQFSNEKNNTPMQIVSKLKEINETLLDTIKFIELYLFKNFQILQKMFSKIDRKLSETFEVESLSLFFLLDIFDLPNNELSYILMFKIIDEESCILKYISEILDNQVKNAKPYNNNNNINNTENNNEVNTMDKDSYLLDSQSLVAYNAMKNIKEKYMKTINESIISIDSYSYFRAKYYNRYIYTKGNYEVDTNLFLNYLNEDNDDNNEEFLPLNSLMDEEVIINKFVKKSVINKFLNFFKCQLPKSFNRNEKLIMLHSFMNNIISVFVIYWYRDYKDGFLDVCLFYLGKLFSKIFFNALIKKRKRLKTLLMVSNIIMIMSFIISIYFIGKDYYKWILLGTRFLIGLSYAKNIETKFIINYVPKLLIKKTIKKYFSLMLLSFSFGFFFTSGFNYIFSFIEEKEKIIEEKINDNNLDVNNVGEIFFCFISFIILIINCMLFKEPKYDDIAKVNTKKDIGLKTSLTSVDINNMKEKQDKKPKKDKDATSIFSYGKAKLISFKEKNKAKLLEAKLKLDTGEKNYEGTNQIFNILQKLIIEESTSQDSYTNRATKGHILLYTLLYIVSSIIIFYNPTINFKKIIGQETSNILDSKNRIWIFGFPYLLSFLIYTFKIIKISSDLFVWNVILLVFIFFEIGLSLTFLIFDQFFFANSPIEFDNYYFYGFLSLILFFNILIEIYTLKVLIREVPIENKISSINIDNFLDIHECLIKAATFGGLYALNHYFLSEKEIYIKILISSLYILSCIIFIYYNFKRRQIALIRIINKVTYESF